MILAGGLVLALAARRRIGAFGQEADTATSSADGPPRTPARGPSPGPREPAKVYIQVNNASGGTVGVNGSQGLRPDQALRRRRGDAYPVSHGGKTVRSATLRVKQIGNRDVGEVSMQSPRSSTRATTSVGAVHEATPAQEAADKRPVAEVPPQVPDLDPGNNSSNVQLFKQLLDARATTSAAARRLRRRHDRARGDGLPQGQQDVAQLRRHPGDLPQARRRQGRLPSQVPGRGPPRRGRHLAPGHGPRRPRQGAAHLPRLDRRALDAVDRGHFRFYRRTRLQLASACTTPSTTTAAEATHGYKSVPPYNASHGCIRNPIPNSRLHLQLDQRSGSTITSMARPWRGGPGDRLDATRDAARRASRARPRDREGHALLGGGG